IVPRTPRPCAALSAEGRAIAPKMIAPAATAGMMPPKSAQLRERSSQGGVGPNIPRRTPSSLLPLDVKTRFDPMAPTLRRGNLNNSPGQRTSPRAPAGAPAYEEAADEGEAFSLMAV